MQNRLQYARRVNFLRALFIAMVLAFFWWFVAIQISDRLEAPLWFDQQGDFTQVGKNVGSPYDTPGFINPPWTAVFLIPFSWIPLKLAVLIQMELYFIALTLIIFRFGGSLLHMLMTLTSFLAFDLSLETNIDWLPYWGLMSPVLLSAPMMLTKPQIAMGAWIGYSPRRLIRALISTIAILLASYVIWGSWIPDMQAALDSYFVEDVNLAPITLIPAPLSIFIGLVLALRAFRRRDVVLGIFAGLFFVPYIALYSLILYFALLTIRLPLLAKVIYLSTWLVYGGIIGFAVVFR